KDARFLSELLQEGIRVRVSQKPFKIDGNSFERGSLIITKADNPDPKTIINLFGIFGRYSDKKVTTVNTGFVDQGKDFGSSYVSMINPVKVAVLSGEPTSTLSFGEVWHFFEQQLGYPLTVIDTDYFRNVDLSAYDVLVLPNGRGYKSFMNEAILTKISDWVADGGRLIAMGGSIDGIAGKDGFKIKMKEDNKSDEDSPEPELYEEAERERMKQQITGAIFRTKVDPTHPLGFGYGDTYFSLKLGDDSYEYLERGSVAYLEDDTKPMAGFAGSEAQKKVAKTLVFGVENKGRGEVVYMVDNPLFRGFWENGKLFFANALFMIN
ncbi:MAG: zinc carboxypeptidase, partial [Muriicola sp.]